MTQETNLLAILKAEWSWDRAKIDLAAVSTALDAKVSAEDDAP